MLPLSVAPRPHKRKARLRMAAGPFAFCSFCCCRWLASFFDADCQLLVIWRVPFDPWLLFFMPRPHLHKSSIVVLVLAAVVAVLIDVPGRVTGGTLGEDQTTEFEHGWPWGYLHRENFRHYDIEEVPPERQAYMVADFGVYEVDVRRNLPRWSIPWLTADNWPFWDAAHDQKSHWRFSAWILLADLFLASCIVAILVGVWEWRRRRRPSICSFRLADLLLFVVHSSQDQDAWKGR